MDNSQFLARDPRQYDFNMAAWIAQEHAGGDSLQALHEAHPDNVPEPLVIARWRREFPAFDALMVEAEKARADVLAEETITAADDAGLTAAQAANRIKARQWLAARLNGGKYGRAGAQAHAPPPTNQDTRTRRRPLSMYSDEDLQDIIRAGLKAQSIDGESTRKETPGTPPCDQRPGLEREHGSDLSEPKTPREETPVTTNAPKTDRSEPEF